MWGVCVCVCVWEWEEGMCRGCRGGCVGVGVGERGAQICSTQDSCTLPAGYVHYL